MSDDPLELKQLAIKYDYLIYKINDHISTLSEQTFLAVTKKTELVSDDYFDQQLQLDQRLQKADQLLRQCNDIDMLFLKLSQLYMFVDDFKERIAHLEREFAT